MWGMITALVSGALMSIQGVFNSAVMKQTSMWVSAGWVQISAFVVCLLMWLFTGRGAVSELWQIEPRYMLTGGVIGSGYKDIFAFVVLIVVLIIRPHGLLGKKTAEKV